MLPSGMGPAVGGAFPCRPQGPQKQTGEAFRALSTGTSVLGWWPEQKGCEGVSESPHDLLSAPGANLWDCFPKGRGPSALQAMWQGASGAEAGVTGVAGYPPALVWGSIHVPASVGGPRSLPLLPLKLLN